MILTRLNK